MYDHTWSLREEDDAFVAFLGLVLDFCSSGSFAAGLDSELPLCE